MNLLPDKDPATLTIDDIAAIFTHAMDLITTYGAYIAIFMLFLGAFFYLTAFGNEEKANKGKTIVYWTIIGLVVILLSKVILLYFENLIK